jgi:hypothetical protein
MPGSSVATIGSTSDVVLEQAAGDGCLGPTGMAAGRTDWAAIGDVETLSFAPRRRRPDGPISREILTYSVFRGACV